MQPRLLINAKWRVHPQTTGVQRYAEGLIGAMESSGLDTTLAIPPSPNRWRAMLWEQRTLPKIASGYDALLCPANMAPGQLDPAVRLLVTIHCLRFRFHPESYSPAFVRWYEHMIPRIIERADTILTVSRAQQAEIESQYPASIGKIEQLAPGVDPVFRPGYAPDSTTPAGPYLLFLGSAAPAKNLAMLLRAYAISQDLPPLVLAGVTPREARIICPEGAAERVFAIGHIEDPRRVAALLANAQCLLAPSRYESFGLPCLEAMACGTPVIASDIPAHREVCGNAAQLLPSDVPELWARHIHDLLSDPQLQAERARQGLARSRVYSWSKTVKSLERVVNSGTGALAR